VVGPVVCVGELKNAYVILGEKHERRRQLGRPKPKSENNIKMNLTE
jgi:hypothetical protein